MDSDKKLNPSNTPSLLPKAISHPHKKTHEKDLPSDEKSVEDKNEKKSRRLSLTPHDKEYYKKKYEQELHHQGKLKESDKTQKIEITSLKNQIDQLTEENNCLKSTIKSLKAESTLVPKIEGPLEKTPVQTPPIPFSYQNQLLGIFSTAYSYLPNFSSLSAKLPAMPRLFNSVENHHEAKVEKMKI